MKLVGMAFGLLLLIGTAADAQIIEPKASPTTAPPQQVVDWVKRRSVPVGSLDEMPSGREAEAIDRITQNARIIGFGESNHGNREPLEYRNRLIRYLVEHRGLTAVALESGLAESRRLYDHVLGAPGDTAALVRSGLTHGFGHMEANVALVSWLRAWNQDHPNRLVRLYGIDHSTILSGPPGVKADSILLDQIIAYLKNTLPTESSTVRAELALFTGRFNENDYPGLDSKERGRLDAALASVRALFDTHRATMIQASSADAFDWAMREAHDAASLPALFRTWSVDGSDLDKLKKVLDLRDGAMAEHTMWVLEREGPKGRVLLFQANGHVTAAPMIGSVMRDFKEQPILTGIALRKSLGEKYRVIVTASSRGKKFDDSASGTIDRAFAAAGRSPALLDVRAKGRSHWWSSVQTASQGDDRLDDMVPADAFDGIVYFDRLTPLPPPKP